MLPFVCGRNIRKFSSTLKLSANVVKRSLRAQTRGKSARSLCVAGGKWMNPRIEDALNKNDLKAFTTLSFSNNLTSVTSLMALLTDCSIVSVEGTGEDDDVTTSAGKKRKHWKICLQEG